MIWKGIIDTLGIKSKMSSPVHLQTDRQTERINKTFQFYLRKYYNYGWDNWEEILAMTEYAYNNSLHSTVNMTPSVAKFSYHPGTFLPNAEPSQNPTSQNNIQSMTSVHQLCRQELKTANKSMRK